MAERTSQDSSSLSNQCMTNIYVIDNINHNRGKELFGGKSNMIKQRSKTKKIVKIFGASAAVLLVLFAITPAYSATRTETEGCPCEDEYPGDLDSDELCPIIVDGVQLILEAGEEAYNQYQQQIVHQTFSGDSGVLFILLGGLQKRSTESIEHYLLPLWEDIVEKLDDLQEFCDTGEQPDWLGDPTIEVALCTAICMLNAGVFWGIVAVAITYLLMGIPFPTALLMAGLFVPSLVVASLICYALCLDQFGS